MSLDIDLLSPEFWDDFIREARRKLGLERYFATLGDSDDLTSSVIDEPGRPGIVRVRLENDDVPYRLVKSGLLGSYSPYAGCPVIVGYDEKDELEIKKADHDALRESGVNPLVFNSGDSRISGFKQTDGLLPLLSGAVGTANTASTEIFVNPFRYVDKSNTVQWFQGDQVDVAASIPAAGNHRYLAIFLKSDNTLETTTSTTQDTVLPLGEADKQECFDARTTNSVPVALWRLHDGQTNLTNSDRIEDLRKWLPSPDPTTFAIPICYDVYDAEPARASESNVHGGLLSLATGQPLDSVPTDIVVTKGIGKVMVVINAGGDLAGEITVTGETIDRETGASTPGDTDTLTVDALTTDNSDTDGNGNTRHAFVGAYITSKWFTGSVTLSTVDLTLSDVDVYHVSFEQSNDRPNITIQTFDVNMLTTNVAAEFDAYLYVLEVAGDKCDISRQASLNVGTDGETAIADKYWRLRRGNIEKVTDGSSDGFWVDIHYSNSPAYIEDVTMKVWVDCLITVAP